MQMSMEKLVKAVVGASMTRAEVAYSSNKVTHSLYMSVSSSEMVVVFPVEVELVVVVLDDELVDSSNTEDTKLIIDVVFKAEADWKLVVVSINIIKEDENKRLNILNPDDCLRRVLIFQDYFILFI